MKKVLLAHGGGSIETSELINGIFYKAFKNEILLSQEDAAVLSVKGALAFSTDSFVVSPIFFKGGDIGKLSIAGTINDLSMMGARPLYLSASFIIEEGFLLKDLQKIANSMATELKKSGALIVTGDTKVVPKGACDGVFINTSGVGEIVAKNLGAKNIKKGDLILASKDIGDHGACILASRKEIDFGGNFTSDCNSLWEFVKALLDAKIKIKAMRDATRGGLSAVLNEWSVSSKTHIQIDENVLNIKPQVRGLCEILGFEPLDLANEGLFLVAVDKTDAKKALAILQGFEFCKKASIIADVQNGSGVSVKNAWNTSRVLGFPKGEALPRIC